MLVRCVTHPDSCLVLQGVRTEGFVRGQGHGVGGEAVG